MSVFRRGAVLGEKILRKSNHFQYEVLKKFAIRNLLKYVALHRAYYPRTLDDRSQKLPEIYLALSHQRRGEQKTQINGQ